jgi:hypothetical protein
MKPLAALLILAAALFVALVMVPQVQQAQPTQPAQPSDLVGLWVIDGEASWEKTRTVPMLVKTIASAGLSGLTLIKADFLMKTAAICCQFTDDKLITSQNGVRREMGYTITAISGNVLTTDIVDDQGKRDHSTITVTKNRLEVADADRPGDVYILYRAR